MSKDKLLVIDDEPDFASFVAHVGEGKGYEVIATSDAQEFRACLESWRPTVVMIDLKMPGVDGVELLREMQSKRCDATVLIASGMDAKLMDTVERLGSDRGLKMGGTVHKPIRAAALGDMLGRFMRVDAPLTAAALEQALERGELILDYQPKVQLSSLEIFGVEALVRWRHPTRGVVVPDWFVPIAEGSGLIDALTVWVVGTAARDTAAWRLSGLPLDISVNVSARNLDDIDFPDKIDRLCLEAGLPTHSMILELTETAAMRDPVQTLDVLSRLRLKGFQLSIDDFGTGYSSLTHLQRLPVSELKIDKSFVMQMTVARDANVIVQIIVDLGRKLGLRVIAEGVEGPGTLQALRNLGSYGAQGHYISRPIAPERVVTVCKRHEAAPDAVGPERDGGLKFLTCSQHCPDRDRY